MRILSHSLSIQTKGMSWGGGVNHTLRSANLYFDRHLKLDYLVRRHNSADLSGDSCERPNMHSGVCLIIPVQAAAFA
jgi:hypothetical protein